MKTALRRAVCIALISAPAAAAERSPYPSLPTPGAVLRLADFEALKARAVKAKAETEAAVKAAEARASERKYVHINVYNYTDGTITVYEPWINIDLRLYKPFQKDFDYQLSGRVANEMVSGDARTKSFNDPRWGYVLSGFGFHAYLDPFGRDWILNGSADRKDPDGRSRRESFNYRIDRVFADSREWRVWADGVDLNISMNGWAGTIDGSYDPARVGPMPLAILSAAAGLINQEKLRQDPTRP